MTGQALASLDVGKVLDFAINIESGGNLFFSQVARKFEKPEISKFFQFLADEELRHKETFKKMKSGVAPYVLNQKDLGQYRRYMEEFYRNQPLDSDQVTREKLAKVTSITDATDFAIDFENQTIVFLSSFRSLLPQTSHGMIDLIIEEEYSHIVKIYEFRRNRMIVL